MTKDIKDIFKEIRELENVHKILTTEIQAANVLIAEQSSFIKTILEIINELEQKLEDKDNWDRL